MYTVSSQPSGRLSRSSLNLQNVPSTVNSTRALTKTQLYASLYGGTLNPSWLSRLSPPHWVSRSGPMRRTGVLGPAITKYSTLRRVTRYGMREGEACSLACLPSGRDVQLLCPLQPNEFGLKNRLVQEVKCACCNRVVAYRPSTQKITRLRVCRTCRFTGRKLNPLQLLVNAGRKIVYA